MTEGSLLHALSAREGNQAIRIYFSLEPLANLLTPTEQRDQTEKRNSTSVKMWHGHDEY